MRNIKFQTGQYYHVYNRGVDKRAIFSEDQDRHRFLHTLISKSITINTNISTDIYEAIEIVCYCLMDNHYHLILKQISKKGISTFMGRVSNSYTKFFNQKYGRSGRLFQSPFQAKHVTNDEYLIHLSSYIHKNPLELNDITVNNLIDYKWSSLGSYLGTVSQRFVRPGIILNQFENTKAYHDYILKVDDPWGE